MRLAAVPFIAAAPLAALSPAAPAAPDSGRTTLLMHYMPWYQTPDVHGSWGGHWTGWRKQHDPEQLDERGLPDVWSEFRPLIGPYDSSDPDVIECHLLQMKLAGVDGVIVDWYGIGQAADYPPNQRASAAIFDACDDAGMTFSVCYEDRTIEHMQNTGVLGPDDAQAHLTETIAWLDEHWFGDERYHKVDGRPLLLNFGPIHVTNPGVWDAALAAAEPRPMYFALHHLWKGVGADGGFTWVHQHAWEGVPIAESIRQSLERTYGRVSESPSTTIVSALPGFDDVYDNSHPYVPHLGGETMRASLDACMSGPWPITQLVTWNDYGEGTVIEPTYEFGYLFLEIIQRARREQERAAGRAFGAGPDDLRLPARLLALRRAGADNAALDRAAALLAEFRCDAARTIIEGLER